MNKTITININGFVFNIEEQAFMRLQKYLNAIRVTFDTSEGADEIMNDIELRIAELFQERLGETREVVTMPDVEYVEGVMGKPQDFAEGTDEEDEEPLYGHADKHRRIYRDPDENMVGGVAAGISHYFGWDPLWIRILFVILTLTGGFGIPIYILLWIIVPEAKTTAEKLRMRGERINVENIKKKVTEEMHNIKGSVKDFADKQSTHRHTNNFKDFVESVFHFLGRFFQILGKVLVKIVGVLLMILGIGLLIGVFAIFLAHDSFLGVTLSELNFTELGEFFYLSEMNMWFFFVGSALLFLAPMAACFYGGFRLLANGRARIPGMGLTLFSLFLLGTIITTIAGFRYAREMTNVGNVKQVTELSANVDTLYINVMDDKYFHNSLLLDDHNILTALHKEEEMVVNGYGVEVRFYSSDSPMFKIEIDKESNAMKETTAVEFADQINFDYTIEDSLLSVAPYIKIPYENGFHLQEVNVRIFVPEGKTVYMDDNIGRVYYKESRGGSYWVMENDEFVRNRNIRKEID